MRKRSYVLSAIVSVALLLVSATVNPVYAGVIQRNATGALTNKEQIGTAASTDGTTITYKDKDGNVVGEEPDKNNWLGPDGVAKMPSYSDLRTIEDYTLDEVMNSKFSVLYRSDFRAGNIEYPEVNPATGRPLWETQPFWREDGSFDLYGYLKQFIPRQDKYQMTIFGQRMGKEFDPKETSKDLIDRICVLHDHQGIYSPHPDVKFSSFTLEIQLVGGSNFDTSKDFLAKNYGYCRAIGFTDDRINDVTIQQVAYLSKDDLSGSKARITGARNSYIYELEIRQLEEIMRRYIEDPRGLNIKSSPDVPASGTGVTYWRDPY